MKNIADKIGDNTIILIELTNVCNKTCSNCTRLCGHYPQDKLFFMDREYFIKAVSSLKDFKGVVGLMGGEPTLHPEFMDLLDIFVEMRPEIKKRGLWSNTLTKTFQLNKEKIMSSFGFFNLNDHKTPIHHTPILTALEDFKDLTPNEITEIIDNCWCENCWSAVINPKGAFFCEIAAAMSILFDGINGWDIEADPDWWKKKVPEYKEQIDWACHKCGCALPLVPRLSSDVTDDVSISSLERLIASGSPKVKSKNYKIIRITWLCWKSA